MLKSVHGEIASDINGADLPADTTTPAKLTLGVAVAGDVQSADDQDWYEVDLIAGQIYYFMVSGSGVSALANPSLTLYGPNLFGEVTATLASDHADGLGGSAWVSYEVTQTGKYYVSASGTGGQGHYTVKAVQMPADQIDGWETTTATATEGQMVDGVAQGIHDSDWYGIDLVANTTYMFVLNSKQQGDIEALTDGILSLNVRKSDGISWNVASASFAGDGTGSATFYFTADFSGKYFIAVGSTVVNNPNNYPYVNAHGGGYSVGFSQAAPDIDAAGPVDAVVGHDISSTLAGSADTDTFAFHLTAGSTYSFYFDGPSSNTLSFDGVASDTGVDALYGPREFGAGRAAHITFTAATTGTYDLVVSGGTHIFDYTVISELVLPDLPASSATSQTLTSGKMTHGFIDSSGDVDWYAVHLKAGQTYVFTQGGPVYSNEALSLVNANGKALSYVKVGGYGDPDSLVYTSTTDQTVYLSATDTSYATQRDYFLTMTQVNDLEGSTHATAVPVSVAQAFHGAIDYVGDSDWFAVDLVAGYTYDLSVRGDNGVLTTSLEFEAPAYIEVPLVSNFNNPTLTYRFETTATGTYYFHTTANSGVGGYTISFGVTDTVASTPATTAVLTLGQPVAGTIYQPDGSVYSGYSTPESDWYAVALTAGQSYVFDVQGTGASPITTQVDLRDADGNPIAGQHGTGGSSHLEFAAPTSGLYYLSIKGGGNVGGGYTVSAAATNDIFSGVNTGTSLTLGAAAHSTIDAAADADWFRVELTAGQSYYFTATPDGASPLGDAAIALMDGNGQLIASSDLGATAGAAGLSWTVPSTGSYFVAVHGQGGATGGYAVTAQSAPPPNPVTAIESGAPVTGHTLKVYFATSGQTYDGHTGTASWKASDVSAFMAAADAWSGVADVTFSQVASASQADLVMVIDSHLSNVPVASVSGQHVVSVPQNWTTADGLNPGSVWYAEFLQAAGYAMGLVHPDSWSATHVPLEPVHNAPQYGDDGLNQGIFTVMATTALWTNPPSYVPDGYYDFTYGWPMGPMALDIAAAQQLYGAVTAHAGNTIYNLPSLATGSTGYVAIWDSSGTDTIVAGAGDALIDLRPASLLDAVGGGGYISYNTGVAGGFSIAAGVVIENATGSAGNDMLIGNDADNILVGNAGFDWLAGGLGNDRLDGGDSVDMVDFSQAGHSITLDLNLTTAQNTGEGMDSLIGIENATGSRFDDTITMSAATTDVDGGAGNDTLILAGNYADYTLTESRVDLWIVRTGSREFYMRNFETLKFNDQTVNIAHTISPSVVSGDWTATLFKNGTTVLTTDDLNAVSGGTATFQAYNINDCEILVDGVSASTFTEAQLEAGKVSFHHIYSPYYTPGFQFSVSGDIGSNTTHQFTVRVLTGKIINDGEAGHAVSGTAGLDSIFGNGGDDTLTGGAGDLLYGGTGDDVLLADGQGWYDGGAGSDTLSLANFAGGVYFYLASGMLFTYYSPDVFSIENVIGTAYDDTLGGNDGDNRLDGGAGVDILIGGKGNDSFYVDNVLDVVRENENEGHDTVYSTVNLDLILVKSVEDVVLTGAASINAIGNYLANNLTGNVGDNWLDGGAGGDVMAGGAGNDTYVVDNVFDRVIESTGQGNDTLRTSFTTTLAANLENLVLTGSANLNGTGTADDNALTGNTGRNILVGLDGNDVINGGAGADRMTGGTGNDTYYVDNAGDVVTELNGGGSDTVISTRTYTLSAFVEKLTLTGTGNTAGTGNALNNTIIGNDGNNKLIGGEGNDNLGGGLGNDTLDGGKGGDTMKGGQGDDRYYVDNKLDVVTEYGNSGNDTIAINGTYTLGLNIENLILTGSGVRFGTGNALDNHLTGNVGNNTLGGADGNDVIDGGKGADTMRGGNGNDIFYVDNIGDTVTEYSGQGVDNVFSSVSFVLGNNVENLTLTGAANLNGTGNGLANVMVGTKGNNSLTGGAGNDTLTGGTGADTFAFGVHSGLDIITDFSAGEGDKIDVTAYAHGTPHTAFITQVGLDSVIDLGGGNVITVQNTTSTDAAFLSHIVW